MNAVTQATPGSGIAYTLAGLTGTTKEAVVTLTSAATLTATNADTKVYMVINLTILDHTGPAFWRIVGHHSGAYWAIL